MSLYIIPIIGTSLNASAKGRLISRKRAKEIVNKSEASLSRYKRRIFKELANYHDQMLLHLHGPLQDADLIPKTANA